jgi:metal-responsive CopG/Arc/MetJ family transcriptional regulator
MLVTRNNQKMYRTTVDLPEDLYFFLKQEVLERQKPNKEASIAAIVRALVENEKKRKDKK